MRSSVLIIGANGRMGQALLHSLASRSVPPSIHAFVRRANSLPRELVAKCDSVLVGDATSVTDVYNALKSSGATDVIVAVGLANSVRRSSVRTDSAKCIASAVERVGGIVRVIVVSSIGAGDSRIRLGYGVGLGLSFYLRHVLSDHTGQEECFQAFFKGREKQLLIVRPTALVEGRGGKDVVSFDGRGRTPSGQIDRSDVSKWIAVQICDDGNCFGQAVTITSAV